MKSIDGFGLKVFKDKKWDHYPWVVTGFNIHTGYEFERRHATWRDAMETVHYIHKQRRIMGLSEK